MRLIFTSGFYWPIHIKRGQVVDLPVAVPHCGNCVHCEYDELDCTSWYEGRYSRRECIDGGYKYWKWDGSS
jgi:hypothetical protein